MNAKQISKIIKSLSSVKSASRSSVGVAASRAVSALLLLRDEIEIAANPNVNYGGVGVQVWSQAPGGVRPWKNGKGQAVRPPKAS